MLLNIMDNNTFCISELKNHENDLEFEKYLLSNKKLLYWMNNLLEENIFTENFLIKTRKYYDSWKCLRNQSNLSVYFCFRYLYDSDDDSADDWTDFNDILRYFNNKYSNDYINSEYERAMKDRDMKDKTEENINYL